MPAIRFVDGVLWKKGTILLFLQTTLPKTISNNYKKISLFLCRCTVRKDCQKANRNRSSPRWLSLSTGQQCIDFEQVQPDRIPIKQMTKVHLTIRTLPDLPMNANYKCVFGSSDPINAIVTGTGLACPTPSIDSRPNIPIGSDHVLVFLSVRSSETNKDFVSRNFAFFDCSRHTICSQCVNAQWGCHWCIYDNLCTHNTSECQGSIISSEKVIDLLITKFKENEFHD